MSSQQSRVSQASLVLLVHSIDIPGTGGSQGSGSTHSSSQSVNLTKRSSSGGVQSNVTILSATSSPGQQGCCTRATKQIGRQSSSDNVTNFRVHTVRSAFGIAGTLVYE